MRAALLPAEARVMELYYDVESLGEMHHNPEKNVLWIAREPGEIATKLGLDEATVPLTIARACLATRGTETRSFTGTSLDLERNAAIISTLPVF